MFVKAKAWKSLASQCLLPFSRGAAEHVRFLHIGFFFAFVPQSRLSWSLPLSQGAAEHVRERFLVCLLRAT